MRASHGLRSLLRRLSDLSVAQLRRAVLSRLGTPAILGAHGQARGGFAGEGQGLFDRPPACAEQCDLANIVPVGKLVPWLVQSPSGHGEQNALAYPGAMYPRSSLDVRRSLSQGACRSSHL
jgi:hypothetical protein